MLYKFNKTPKFNESTEQLIYITCEERCREPSTLFLLTIWLKETQNFWYRNLLKTGKIWPEDNRRVKLKCFAHNTWRIVLSYSCHKLTIKTYINKVICSQTEAHHSHNLHVLHIFHNQIRPTYTQPFASDHEAIVQLLQPHATKV